MGNYNNHYVYIITDIQIQETYDDYVNIITSN
jgi:hypothetical protein